MPPIMPNWPAPAHIKAATTIRSGWGAYGTNPKGQDATTALKSYLSLPANPIWLDQTHSTLVVPAVHREHPVSADGSYTDQPHAVCTVLTADCLPVLICDTQGSHVAAIHAGWRGLAGGILENAITALPISPENILVWLGPAIGPVHFEVGQDVYDAFTKQNPALATAFKPKSSGKWLADLYLLARLKLNACGATHIYGGEYCTYSQSDLFYSYRRDSGKTGRMASVIWIDAET